MLKQHIGRRSGSQPGFSLAKKMLGLLISNLSISATMACASPYPEIHLALGMPISEFNAQPAVKAKGATLDEGPASMWGTDDYTDLLVTINGTIRKFEIRNKYGLYLTSSNLEGPGRPHGPTTIRAISFGTGYLGNADHARDQARELCGKFATPPIGVHPEPFHVAYPFRKWGSEVPSSDLVDRHERICEVQSGLEAFSIDIERSTRKDNVEWRVRIDLQSTLEFQGTDIRPFN